MMRIASVAKLLGPHWLVEWRLWTKRFLAVGFSPQEARRAALSVRMRSAIVSSRLELLHPSLHRALHLVVDVGLNEGQWISSLLAMGHVDRVEAFEPNPAAVEIASRRLSGRNVRIHATALGDRGGSVTLNITESSDFASILTPRAELTAYYNPDAVRIARRLEVPVSTLDDFLRDGEHIDLLKIDVQGTEASVLAGARRTLERTRAILIEVNFASHYEGDSTWLDLAALLTNEYGFSFWNMAPPMTAAGRPLWADAVFINPRMLSPDGISGEA